MQRKLNRTERLVVLAEICRQNNLTPMKNTFSGFIIKVCVNNLGVTQAVAKEHLKALNTAWKADQWKSILGEAEESLETTDFEFVSSDQPDAEKFVVTTIEQKSEVFKSKTLDVLNNMGKSEPVHKVKAKVTEQLDRISEKEQAQILYRRAREETANGIGRLLLFDVRDILDNKKMSMQELITFWQKHYPAIEIDQATGNVLKIYWDGKEAFRYRAPPIIPPKAPEFKHDKNEGDVHEDSDDTDELPEANDNELMTL